jgi:hypothetical protein
VFIEPLLSNALSKSVTILCGSILLDGCGGALEMAQKEAFVACLDVSIEYCVLLKCI